VGLRARTAEREFRSPFQTTWVGVRDSAVLYENED
jgi:hypothetical protein